MSRPTGDFAHIGASNVEGGSGVNKPLVSVLMASHRADPALVAAVDSILNQTYPLLELVLVDDGAPGGFGLDIATRIQRDRRIRLLRNESNQGLATSLNRAMAEARGAYCARMDADDISRPHRIAKQVAFLEDHPQIAICGSAVCKRVSGRGHRVQFPRSDAEIRAMLLFHSAFAHPSVMWRRADFERINLRYEESFLTAQDYELWSRALGPLRGANLPDVLLDYNCHSDQVTAKRYKQSIAYTRAVHERVVRRLIPDAAAEQMALHARIAIPHDAFDLAALKDAEQWLLALIEANERQQVYDRRALKRIFARQWAMICGMSAGEGMRAFARYLASPLSAPLGSASAAAKLFARCAFRRPG